MKLHNEPVNEQILSVSKLTDLNKQKGNKQVDVRKEKSWIICYVFFQKNLKIYHA